MCIRDSRCVQWEGVVCVAHSVTVVVDVLGEGRGAAADDSVRLTVAVGVNVRASVRWEGVAVVTVAGPIRACWGVTVGVVPLSRIQREGVGVVIVTVTVTVRNQGTAGVLVYVQYVVGVVIVVETGSVCAGRRRVYRR